MFLFGKVSASSAADLVVEDDWNVVAAGKVDEWEHVIVRDAGAAVEDNEGADVGGELAVDLKPCLTFFARGRYRERNFSLRDLGNWPRSRHRVGVV